MAEKILTSDFVTYISLDQEHVNIGLGRDYKETNNGLWLWTSKKGSSHVCDPFANERHFCWKKQVTLATVCLNSPFLQPMLYLEMYGNNRRVMFLVH